MVEFLDLNARHEAALIWYSAFLTVAIVGSSDIRSSCLSLLKTLSEGMMLGVVTALLLFVVVLTTLALIVGRTVGLFEVVPGITATVWFLTSGFTLLFSLDQRESSKGLLRAKIRTVLAPSAFFAALFNVAILPFWWEVALLPVITILVYASIARSSGVANLGLLIYAAGLILVVIVDLVESPASWKILMQAIFFPIWLTLGSTPYLFLLTRAEKYRFESGVKSKFVRDEDYGAEWPLTVNSAKLCCIHRAVWVEVDGKKYGVNGTSRGLLSNYGYESHDLNVIWRPNPVFEDVYVSIHRLLQDGLSLEEDK